MYRLLRAWLHVHLLGHRKIDLINLFITMLDVHLSCPSLFQMDFSSDSMWATKDCQPDADAGIAPLTIQQLRQIYQQQLDHQRQETQAAQAQIKLLTQHLDNEATARQVLQVQQHFFVIFIIFLCVLVCSVISFFMFFIRHNVFD